MQSSSKLEFTIRNKLFYASYAKLGWYRYDVRFAIPVYENDVLVRYNVLEQDYLLIMLKTEKYLYDILTIKKKRASHNNKCGENPFLV